MKYITYDSTIKRIVDLLDTGYFGDRRWEIPHIVEGFFGEDKTTELSYDEAIKRTVDLIDRGFIEEPLGGPIILASLFELPYEQVCHDLFKERTQLPREARAEEYAHLFPAPYMRRKG